MEKKQDLRVIKTIYNIENSFIALLEEKNFSAITVQDILDRALINRKTFYRYYRDKYDLAEIVIHKFFSEIEQFFDKEKELDFITEAYQTLYKNKRMILALWNVKTPEVDFYTSLLALMQQRYKSIIDMKSEKTHNIELQCFLTATLMLQSMKYLLEKDCPFTSEDLLNSFTDTYVFLTKELK